MTEACINALHEYGTYGEKQVPANVGATVLYTMSYASPLRLQSSDIEARPYQLELLDSAIEDNTIVLLGTGGGKTFVAVMLIKELSQNITLPFNDLHAKRSVFLVNTGTYCNSYINLMYIHMVCCECCVVI